MDATMISDSRVLELRQAGRSFRFIAKKVGLERPADAWLAFNRALRRHGPDEQESLRRDEMGRLDAMSEAIKGSAELSAEDQTKRLASLDRMRQRLLAV